MINLYSEIKNYVVRIKTLLSKALEQQLEGGEEQETRLIIQYLIVLGEDKAHLKTLFLKFKTMNVKKKIASIVSLPRQSEVCLQAYSRLQRDQ